MSTYSKWSLSLRCFTKTFPHILFKPMRATSSSHIITVFVTFRNMLVFTRQYLVSFCLTLNLEYHPWSSVSDCTFNIIAVYLLNWQRKNAQRCSDREPLQNYRSKLPSSFEIDSQCYPHTVKRKILIRANTLECIIDLEYVYNGSLAIVRPSIPDKLHASLRPKNYCVPPCWGLPFGSTDTIPFRSARWNSPDYVSGRASDLQIGDNTGRGLKKSRPDTYMGWRFDCLCTQSPEI